MKIHRDGLKTIILVWCISLLLMLISFYCIRPTGILSTILFSIIIVFLLLLMCWISFFFRVPRRGNVEGENVVTSVCDGEVVIVEKVTEPEFFKGECLQVSVYMSFFNVHVNYWPIKGTVSYYKYHPGRYLLAFLPKASELNEHSSIGLDTPYGKVFFKQMAGTFARRIVTYGKPGDPVEKAKQCGLIKFGSRIDLFLPLDADIHVEVGDSVRACESVIATLK
ncbi:MAG: phosphatidylserine decarboxylase family protein [Bacteroidales bacterium]|nr:phosphatidylserine decarboxylase family protein [Bacteroidales bacterium]